ncbi:MFS transporter [Streptomyces sp. NPDC004539]|uniref:MFS transporter n=1 Tax=Streptomyces sp. NPDC004539 TaxID=3154280 RepID=UPI0033AEFAC7
MPSVLRHPTYRRLFTAQVVALVGTGLATVALSLLAYDLAGADAGSVLGTALAVKMVAYVGTAPLIGAATRRLPRRTLLIGADVTRAGAALTLPFVTEVWQVYLLIFLLQSASAAFTPAFQAVIPEILPEERDYTRALSLSRLAYDLESLFSPALAAALLTLVSYDRLFLGTVAGFLASAALVVSVTLPDLGASKEVRGGAVRLFRSTPRLRALLALNLAVAAASAMVTVNTVVYVRDHLHRSAADVPLALGSYGAGSMTCALLLPRLLDRRTDRSLMLPAAFALAALLGLTAAGSHAPTNWRWPALLVAWAAVGAATSLILTPTGRLIRRSAARADLSAAFAAQFSLSHGCWLLTYPLAGWLGATAGLSTAALALAALAGGAALLALRLWPAHDPARVEHVHHRLTGAHPHLTGAHPSGAGWRHTHDYVIDDLHHRWPRPATH